MHMVDSSAWSQSESLCTAPVETTPLIFLKREKDSLFQAKSSFKRVTRNEMAKDYASALFEVLSDKNFVQHKRRPLTFLATPAVSTPFQRQVLLTVV